jgi:glutamate carboxypeptidase
MLPVTLLTQVLFRSENMTSITKSAINLEQMLSDLERLVNLESPTRTKELTDKAVSFFVERFQQLTGGCVEFFSQEEFGNHAKLTLGEGDEQLLILGHIDTVWPAGEVTSRPFQRDESRVYGPGIFDMKCGLIQGLYAIHHVVQMTELKKKIVFLVNTDEEIGSPTSRSLIEAEAKKSTAVFVLEPAMGRDGALKTSRKGVGRFTIKVEGKSAHSGIDHEKGVSAIKELAHQILKVESLTDYDKGTTVNVGKVTGGGAVNVVPSSAEASVDLRVKTKEEAKRVTKEIMGLKPAISDSSLQVEGGMERPPMERQHSVDLFEQIQEIARELHIPISEKSTGGGSDGNLTANLGVPTLDGLGAVGDGAHALHEYVEIKKIPERCALFANLLLNILNR